ncbi:MAG: hypothetical protein J6M53_00665 [Bacteroidaceae bacterium]|nr:hypothetical protein [Bacteroidaceae bacterium]
MKRLLLICFVLVAALGGAQAQSYKTLWKKAEAAQADDLPRTALEYVTQIQRKAEADGNATQLLRARLTLLTLGEDISSDSAAVEIDRIRAARDAEQRPVERALWNAALARTLEYRQWQNEAYRPERAACYEALLTDMPALAGAKTKRYLPLFEEGADSKYFGGDVLHVLARQYLDDYASSDRQRNSLPGRLITFYRSRGNREAALLWTLDSLDRNSASDSYDIRETERFRTLRRIADENRALRLNVETYVRMTDFGYRSDTNDSLRIALAQEGLRLYGSMPQADKLRNFIMRTEQPELSLQNLPSTVYPGKGYGCTLRFKARTACELLLYRLDGQSARSVDEAGDEWRKMPRRLVRTYPFSITERPAYVSTDTAVTFVAPPEPGVYVVAIADKDGEYNPTLLHCTRLNPMVLQTDGGGNRVTIVDALSGAPIAGTSMVLATRKGDRAVIRESLQPDADGAYRINAKNRKNRTAWISLGDDNALPEFSLDSYSAYGRGEVNRTSVRLYTDRGIYRPGQKVLFGGFVFTQHGDSVRAEAGRSLTVTLIDSHNKQVGKQKLQSDDLGNIGGELTLPATVLPGTFTLRADGTAQPTSMTIEVQEYKRPTFTVEFDPVTRTYAPGDTLVLTGTARTYSGLPVEGARVRYETQRYRFYHWFRQGNESAAPVCKGDTLTDAEGRFAIPVILYTERGSGRNCFTTRVDVTSAAGETQTATRSDYTSYNNGYLTTGWPQTVCFERMPKVTPRLINASGTEVTARGTLTVKLGEAVVLTDSVTTGEPFRLTRQRLPAPGKYTLVTEVESGGEKFKQTDVVRFFSEHDTRPASGDTFWYNIRQSVEGDSAYVIIGSALRDVTMFVDVFNGDEILESRRITFSDSLLHFALGWRPEYGEGANVTFAFVKDEQLYKQNARVVKPQPDKRLTLGWTTFRSLLTPGQHEEWRLRVTLPDGTPARAALMARLYDTSLDALRPYQWHFAHAFPRYQPFSAWTTSQRSTFSVKGSYALNLKDEAESDFTHWNDALFSGGTYRIAKLGAPITVGYAMATADAAPRMMMARVANADAGAEVAMEESKASGADDDAAALEAVDPRTNFSETAFFFPALRTEEDGGVTLAFTLPESLTQWNFRALAHTADMRVGTLDTFCVARKEFMVEPALPRFVREGDRAQIPVTVRNLTDKALGGTLLLQLLDATGDKVLLRQTLRFDAPAGGSEVQTFDVDATQLAGQGITVCRITGKSGLYGDGEEHYLPVLSAREQVTRSLAFTLTDHTPVTLRTDTLWSRSTAMADRQLTVEVSSNPAWYVVNALPVLADQPCHTATQWAERLYAIVLARHIADQNPAITKALGDTTGTGWASVLSRNADLKNTLAEESPWLVEAENETQRAAALATLFDNEQNALRLHSALDGLRKLQRGDGSWSWCPGMDGSPYITSRIALVLARLERLTGYETDMLPRAVKFLEAEAAKYVKQAKEHNYKGCPYIFLRYLYARALTGNEPATSAAKADVKYLVERIADDVAREDMHTKSLCAVVLAHYGKTAEAQTALQSLIEHTTVGDPQRGRFFDTRRAPMTWGSYRIPTQTSTMEALAMTAPEVMWNAEGGLVASRDRVLSEMRLWLLQAKRTQMWETSSASLDAIYALLVGTPQTEAAGDLARQTSVARYTLQDSRRRIVAANRADDAQGRETVGYVCDRFRAAPQVDVASVTVRGYDNSVGWGAVYATYTLPVEDVTAAGEGLALTRRIEVRRDGKWVAVKEGEALHVGDRLRVAFTLTADRDYDYLSLRTGRPACTEPADRLSGYRYTDAGGCYRVVRDTDLQYFFERMPKGVRTFTDELVIDRAGTYTFAPSRLQSLYSPEFQAIAPADVLCVE